MKQQTLESAILKYLTHLNTSTWIEDEAYKFEFANYLQSNLDFDNQTDQEVFNILVNSQRIKYGGVRGIQFIQKSGRETLSEYIRLSDVALFRQLRNQNFEDIDWTSRGMSFTVLSAWLASIFPERFYPVPMRGLNETINYLFATDLNKFPKKGQNYIASCQSYFRQTEIELRKYPLKEIHLRNWNAFYREHSELNISEKSDFDQADWCWLAQDFHLFIHRNILNLYKPKGNPKSEITTGKIDDDFEPIAIEGQSKLAIHMRYERDSAFIKKLKEIAIKSNPMLNCEVCGFSFCEKYGTLGMGFIEAHHKNPLSITNETKTTKEDIALVCSNCHKMLHKGISETDESGILTLEELKELLS